MVKQHEFEQREFEQREKGFDHYLALLLRRKWFLIIPAIVIFLTGAALTFSMPTLYRAEAKILIERQDIPEDMIQSTITAYAYERIQFLTRLVMSNSNLEGVLEKLDLYSGELKILELSSLVNMLRNGIEIETVTEEVIDPRTKRPRNATIAFTVAFENESPIVAQQVATELANLFLAENKNLRAKVTRGTSVFLRQEAERIGQDVSRLDAQITRFKQANADALPDRMNGNVRQIDRIEDQIRDDEREIRSLEERALYLQSQLAHLSPTAVVYSADGERIMGPEDRLRALEAEYLSKTARYSNNHPDLVRLRLVMEALNSSVGGGRDTTEIRASLNRMRSELSAAEGRYSDEHPEVKTLRRQIAELERELNRVPGAPPRMRSTTQPNNPAYIQLQTQLHAIRIEIEALEQTQEDLRQELLDYEDLILKGPVVESQLRVMTRDYEEQLEAYRGLTAKEIIATMAASLEQGQQGERLTIIEMAELPLSPHSPNIIKMLFLTAVLSCAGGVGAVVLRESTDYSFHNASEIAELLGAQPLSAIPYISTPLDQRKRMWIIVGVAIVIAAGIYAGLWHYDQDAMPLDEVRTSVPDRNG